MTLLFIVTLYIAFAVLSSGTSSIHLCDKALDRKWLGPYVRISLGIVGTFWITILRTLFVLAACKDDKSILLEEHSCGGAGTGALAVSAVFIAAFWAMYGASWLTHETSPLSHNALARTSCKFDMIHSFWLAAIVTTGLVLRPYSHDGVYDLHVPYAVAGCMMVGGAHQWYYLSTNQPFFSKSMNDFKAACSAGVLWTGIMTLAISIMYKIMEKDHSGPGQGMADFTEEIRTAMTIAYLRLLLPAMALGWNRSKSVRDNIAKRCMVGYMATRAGMQGLPVRAGGSMAGWPARHHPSRPDCTLLHRGLAIQGRHTQALVRSVVFFTARSLRHVAKYACR